MIFRVPVGNYIPENLLSFPSSVACQATIVTPIHHRVLAEAEAYFAEDSTFECPLDT